ncbi:hypothetical protein LJC17_01880 [Acholeplasma sp. OttesenSCG-928-E16]|nr:hypothetical protein [Acholeplasma sp. OttesenSCG-928-E16]
MNIYASFIDWLKEPFWGGLAVYIWLIIGLALLLVIALVIVLLAVKSSKKKKAEKALVAAKEAGEFLGADAYKSFEGLYFNDSGAKIIISGSKVWLINQNGKTDLINSADDSVPVAEGEKIYVLDHDVITKVIKVGDDYEKIEKDQINYLTLTFVNKAKVLIGDVAYMR